MAIIYKTFTSTNTGNTMADCVTKVHEILDNLAVFLCGDETTEGVLQGFTFRKSVWNDKVTPKVYLYEFGEMNENGEFKNAVIRMRLNINQTDTSYSSYNNYYTIYCMIYSNTDQGERYTYYTIQSSNIMQGIGQLKLCCVTGKDGNCALCFSNHDSGYSGEPTFVILNTKTLDKKKDKILIGKNSSYFFFTSYTDSRYYSINEISNVFQNSQLAVGSGYDILTPVIIPNTEYMCENLYHYTNSPHETRIIITDGTKRYAVFGGGTCNGYMVLEQ